MKILVATDGSAESNMAVQSIAGRPWPPATVARVLSVVQPAYMAGGPEGMNGAVFEQVEAQSRAEATRAAAQAAETLKNVGMAVDTKLRSGDPRSEIVDEATDWGSDLIVLGSTGRTGLSRWLLGSVAEGVVRQAPCSVEIARGKRTAKP